MNSLETKLKELGLYFTYKRALYLSLAITVSLKILESQFVVIPNLIGSAIADYIRSYVFVVASWYTLDLSIHKIDRLPSFLSKYIRALFLVRYEEFDFKQYVQRLFLSFVLSFPVYICVFFLIQELDVLKGMDYFEFTFKRAVTFYFLFTPFLITVLDLKIQFFVSDFINSEKIYREMLLKEKEVQLFKAKLKPHFLFNTLNSIASLIRLSPQKAEEMVENLSDFFRNTLEYSDKEFITIEEELDIINNLIKIEKSRFDHRLIYKIEIDDDLYNKKIPALLIQPFIENAIKYGVEKSIQPVTLFLKIQKNRNSISITVSDDGKGCDLSTIKNGYGMKTTFERLNHYFGERCSYELCSERGKGFVVHLEIPLKELTE